MNEPIFEIDELGTNVFLEVEGRPLILPAVFGADVIEFAKIMGWDECETFGDILEREQYARSHEPAPRMRFWRVMPTDEERKNGEWHNDVRVWIFNFIGKDLSDEELDRRYEEWCATGRVNFDDE